MTRLNDRYLLVDYYIGQPTAAFVGRAPEMARPLMSDLPEADTQTRMGVLYASLSRAVAEAAAAEERPVVLAGDCCAAIGVLAGLQHAGLAPTLVWLDAHGDFNDWTTTPSGFLGGMPLAMIVGRGDQGIMHAAGAQPLDESSVWLIDGRDLDPGEREAVASSSIRHVRDVSALGQSVALPEGPLWVHFDVDVVDPVEMGAVNYPVPGGPASEEVRRAFRALARTGRVVTASLSAWDGPKDRDGRSADLALSLLSELLA